MTRRRLLRLILALYPAWWRQRYGAEAEAILDSSPPGVGGGLDLLRGALDAWTKQRPPRLAAFARFSDEAREIIVLAQKEAHTLGLQYVGTEHVLLGLLAAPLSPANQVLASLGVSPERVRARLLQMVGPGQTSPLPRCANGSSSVDLPKWSMRLTPRAKQGFSLSCRAADRLGDADVGAEHLLLGLLEAEKGIGARLLAEIVTPEIVRQELSRGRHR